MKGPPRPRRPRTARRRRPASSSSSSVRGRRGGRLHVVRTPRLRDRSSRPPPSGRRAANAAVRGRRAPHPRSASRGLGVQPREVSAAAVLRLHRKLCRQKPPLTPRRPERVSSRPWSDANGETRGANLAAVSGGSAPPSRWLVLRRDARGDRELREDRRSTPTARSRPSTRRSPPRSSRCSRRRMRRWSSTTRRCAATRRGRRRRRRSSCSP